jgi:hypothetical protein
MVVNALRTAGTLLRHVSAATECVHSAGCPCKQIFARYSPSRSTADPATDENSNEVAVAGRLSGSIACTDHADNVHRKRRARMGQQDKIMDGTVEL